MRHHVRPKASLLLCLVALATLAFTTFARPAAAAPNRLFDDPRMMQWSRDWIAGRAKDVLVSVEQDLKSGTPHPFAPKMWCEIQQALTHDVPGAVAKADPAVVRGLGKYPAIHQVYYVEDHAKRVFDLLPAASAVLPTDAWSTIVANWAAGDLDRPRDKLAYVAALAQSFPDLFLVAWEIISVDGSLQGEDKTHDDLLARARSAPLAGTPNQKFLERMLTLRQVPDLDALAAVDDFLKDRPNDAWAHAYRAYKLAAAGRYEDAAKANARAFTLLPFTHVPAIQEWIRAGREDEARAQALAQARLEVLPADAAAARVEADVAKGMRGAGERGRARALLEKALAKWPSDERLQEEMAELELACDRPAQALPFARKALELSPTKAIAHHTRLIDALRRSGKPTESYDAYQRLVASRTDRTPWSWYLGSEALEAAERRAERVTLMEQAAREHPDSAFMKRELASAYAAAERKKDALTTAKAAFDLQPDFEWVINRVIEWTKTDAGDAAVDVALAQMRARFPWIEQLWVSTADRIDGQGKEEKRIALWKQAQAAVPTRQWGYEREIMVLHGMDRFDDAERAVRSTMQKTSGMPVGDQVSTLLDLAWTVRARAVKGRYDPATVDEALKLLEQFKQRGGAPWNYHYYRAELFVSLGRQREAKEASLAHSASQPDSSDSLWRIFNNLPDAEGKWTAARRYLDRDPYNAARLKTLRQMHSLYGGSPVVALYLSSLLRERAPSDYDSSAEGTAYQALGDAVRNYEASYARATSVSPSDRYVGWYDHARLQAQEAPTAVGLPFDPKSQTRCPINFARKLVTPGSQTWAVICHDTGEVLVREDHPISGKVRLLQHGAAFVRFTYDEPGQNLLRIEASSGQWMALDYDAKNRITRIKQPGGKEVDFEYNDHDKPVKMTARGVGEIVVTYKPNDEIDKVESPQGRKVALEVTSTYQRLLDLIRPASGSASNVPELPHADPNLDRLREQVERAHAMAQGPQGEEMRVRWDLKLAQYLVDNVEDSRRYSSEAESITGHVLREARAKTASPNIVALGLDAATLWYRLKLVTRPAGLGTSELDYWNDLRSWLEARLGGRDGKRAADLLKQSSDRPLSLMQNARWLPRSDINTPGPWRRWPLSRVMPEPLRRATLRTVLVRKNHDVVVGTSAGIVVLHKGFWGWFGFDETRSRFSSLMPFEKANASSDVLALAEDDAGALWIGTGAALVSIAGDYATGEQKTWRTPEDGLPSSRIEALAATNDGMFVGTSGGARIIDAKGQVSKPGRFADEPIVSVSSARAFDKDAPLLVVTPNGLAAWSDGRVTDLVRGAVASAAWSPEASKAIYLQDKTLFAVRWAKGAPPEAPQRLPGQQDVVFQSRINGVSLMPIDREGTLGVAVMTDLGISLFSDNHFEHLDLRGTDKRPGVTDIDARDGRAYVLSTEGIFALELAQENVHRGRVYDLLTLDDLGMTVVARESGLYAIKHDGDDTREQLVDRVYATVLAAHPKGGWVTNDGNKILRYNPQIGAPQELFDATPSNKPDSSLYADTPVRSILVSSDETVWVASGSYLYRFKDGKKEEYSSALDPDKFPVRSEMISRVVETIDKKVWVIASNEGHLRDKGMILEGGVVEWTGSGWKRLDLQDQTRGWFIRSYTALDKDTAIAGTTAGFARHRGGRFELVDVAGDPSYKRVLDRQPQLYLGTRGAKIGSIWLFGAAGGVVALKDGTWFVPDRLNWMLPDQGLAGYGSRHVHAIETDKRGRVYVGTDRGLLVYDSGGGDAASFLLTNEMEIEAFSDAAAEQLQRESDVLLGNVAKDSAISERIGRVNALRKDIDALKGRLDPTQAPRLTSAQGTTGAQGTQGQAAPKLTDDERKKVEASLREKEKALSALLLRIESETPGLSQMLELKPIDLASLRGKLMDDQVIVQYLPTDKRLYVQVVTKSSREVREVEVPRAELMARALHVANRLGGRRTGAMRGLVLVNVVEEGQPPLEGELAWLYEQLLRPIEGDVAGKKYVYVVPVGELTYLPFAALIRQQKPKVEYAVEKYAFGYLTSLYMFELMLRAAPSTQPGAFVLGDPDGSLPGARAEAAAVAGFVKGSTLRLGKDATYETLVNDGTKAQTLHFATHGLLDHQRPERSALLLANNVRLTVPDAMTLKLTNTELVVLSACDTGIGRSGLEYATLARAFMNAGVSTVLATLWQVDDEASKQLMESFYKRVAEGDDRLTALATSQRALLKAQGDKPNPSRWASYIAFGKP